MIRALINFLKSILTARTDTPRIHVIECEGEGEW